jgi:hypothetical protein
VTVFCQVAQKPGPDKFVDFDCCVYKDWNDFLESSHLPEGTYSYPSGGVYNGNENDKVILEFGKTPASSSTNTSFCV